jgi:hypothetical protein
MTLDRKQVDAAIAKLINACSIDCGPPALSPRACICEALRDLALLALAKPQEGWRMVPEEPTDAMLSVMEQGPVVIDGENWHDYQRRAWALILGCLPAAPDKQEGKL